MNFRLIVFLFSHSFSFLSPITSHRHTFTVPHLPSQLLFPITPSSFSSLLFPVISSPSQPTRATLPTLSFSLFPYIRSFPAFPSFFLPLAAFTSFSFSSRIISLSPCTPLTPFSSFPFSLFFRGGQQDDCISFPWRPERRGTATVIPLYIPEWREGEAHTTGRKRRKGTMSDL